MAKIWNLRVTLNKYGLKDSYFPKVYEPFNLRRGDKVQFNDDINELWVKVPGKKQLRRVKIAKKDIEKFTEYIL